MVEDAVNQQKLERDKLLSLQYIPRNAELNLSGGLINVIIGPRRAGKSSFGLNSLKGQNFGYLNFDDDRLIGIQNFDELITAVDRVYALPEILFFDEIQNVSGWELLINRLHRNGRKIVITGSNSNLLSGELSTHLSGRNYSIMLLPFSFDELVKEKDNDSAGESKNLLYNMLETGGYPEVIVKQLGSKEYLKMIFRDTIYKDIVARYKPRDPAMVESIASYLISNTGAETSIRSLSSLVGYNTRTVSKYLFYLMQTMLFFPVSRFSFSMKEQIRSNKKIYAIDNGFMNSVGFNFSPNRGKKLENFAAIELYRRSIFHDHKIFFWKHKHEVDFLIQKGNTVTQLIQVSADLSDIRTKDREMRALVEASKETRCDNLIVITDDYSDTMVFEWFGEKREIKYITFFDWLNTQERGDNL